MKRTVTLTDKACETIVGYLALDWATAKTYSLIPCAARVWDYPIGRPLKERLKWSNAQGAKARELQTVLEQFGCVLPEIDVARYVIPSLPGSHIQKGDLHYSFKRANDYRRELVAEILASMKVVA